MEGSQVGGGVHEEGAEQVADGAGAQDTRPSSVAIEQLLAEGHIANPGGVVDVNDFNAMLLQRLAGHGTLDPSVVFGGITMAFEDSLLFLADLILRPLSEAGMLEQPYDTIMMRVIAGLDHIRLRGLYDAMVMFEQDAAKAAETEET